MQSEAAEACRIPIAASMAITVLASAVAIAAATAVIPAALVVSIVLALLAAQLFVVAMTLRRQKTERWLRHAHVSEARSQTERLSTLNQQLAAQSREIAHQALQLAQQRDGYKTVARDLAEKQAWMDSVLTQLPAGILLIDMDLNVVNRNERFRNLLGLPADAPAPKSLADLQGWPAETADGKIMAFEEWPLIRALRDGVVTHELEMRVGKLNGEWFHAAVSAGPIYGPDGVRRGGVLLMNDLTQRQRNEETLRLLESAVVNANDAIIVLEAVSATGKGRRVKYVNEAFEILTGYSRADVKDRSLHFLKGANSDAATLESLRIALDQAKPFRTELLNYRKDGVAIWVDLSLVPVRGPDGRCTHYIMIQRDITTRKIAEGKLKQSEELFRGIYEATSAGVSITDEKGRFVSCNPAFADLVGRTMADVIGKTAAEITHPDDWAAQQPYIEAIRIGSVDRYAFPKRYVKPDGTIVWAELTFASIFDSDGLYQYGLGVSVDVTARRALEEQLRQSQKMEALGQLAGGIAHDFNNLLTAVLGNLALLKLPEHDPNRNLLSTVELAAGRAADLTRKLLGYARRNQILASPLQPSMLLEEVVAILRRTLDPRIEMVVHPGTNAYVNADGTLLHQAIMNLCINARDAMATGGTLTLSAEDVTLHADDLPGPDARPGQFVRLTVRDTGHGMSDTVQERLFEPFFTTKGVGKGTGLGLPMVHGILRQHEGWITVESALGRGSTFRLYLPMIAAPEPVAKPLANPRPQEPKASPETSTADKPTILLVDDESMIRMLGRNVLQSGGYDVLEAADGAEALEVYEANSDLISLVVLDLTMPRLSGKDTYQRLRLMDPEVNVLFSSGYAAEDLSDIDQATLLSKPYRPQELLTAVRKMLRRNREKVPVA